VGVHQRCVSIQDGHKAVAYAWHIVAWPVAFSFVDCCYGMTSENFPYDYKVLFWTLGLPTSNFGYVTPLGPLALSTVILVVRKPGRDNTD